jgi:hypothetical protein
MPFGENRWGCDMRFLILILLLNGCLDNPNPFEAGEESSTEMKPDLSRWLPRGEDTDTAEELPTELEDIDTAGELSTELEDTDTAGEASTELEDTDTAGEIPTELEDTDTAGEIPTELEDTDTAGEIPTELEDTDTCGELLGEALCPPMTITLPSAGAYQVECILCETCQTGDCYGVVVETCDGFRAWSPDELPSEMEREGCQYVHCCD